MDTVDFWRLANAALGVGAFTLLLLRLIHVWGRLSFVFRLHAEALLLLLFVVASASVENVAQDNPAGTRVGLTTLALAFVWWAVLRAHYTERRDTA